MDTTIQLETEFIALGALLKLTGVVGSGGEAKRLLADGLVLLNEQVEVRRGAKVRPGDEVRLDTDPMIRIVVERADEPAA